MNQKGIASLVIIAIAIIALAIPTTIVVSQEFKNSELSKKPVETTNDLLLIKVNNYYADFMRPNLSEPQLAFLDSVFGASYAAELMIVKDNRVVYRVFASKSAHDISLSKGVPDETIKARISIDYETAEQILAEYEQTKHLPDETIKNALLGNRMTITPITELAKILRAI